MQRTSLYLLSTPNDGSVPTAVSPNSHTISEEDCEYRKRSIYPYSRRMAGVAILFVLIFHGAYNTHDFPYSSVPFTSTVIGKLGALGVLIFFAISGYLITKKLYEETPAQSSINLRAFFIKRIFRILPPLAVYLTILIALSLMGYITLVRGDWAAPFFLSNYISGSWYTSHFWSLSVEEHFYLFWPLCMLAFGWRRSFGVGIVLVIAVGIYR